MEYELKPCPFCGEQKYVKVSSFDGYGGYGVVCNASGFDSDPNRGCGASSGYGDTEEAAAARWNRREAAEQHRLALLGGGDE